MCTLQICSNRLMLSSRQGPKSLNNVSDMVLSVEHPTATQMVQLIKWQVIAKFIFTSPSIPKIGLIFEKACMCAGYHVLDWWFMYVKGRSSLHVSDLTVLWKRLLRVAVGGLSFWNRICTNGVFCVLCLVFILFTWFFTLKTEAERKLVRLASFAATILSHFSLKTHFLSSTPALPVLEQIWLLLAGVNRIKMGYELNHRELQTIPKCKYLMGVEGYCDFAFLPSGSPPGSG